MLALPSSVIRVMCVTLQAGPLEVRLIAATNYELGANICVRLLHENSKAICSFVFSSARLEAC